MPSPDRYLYAKIGSEKTGVEGAYSHHVMVEVKRSRTPIRQTLKHKWKNPAMRISYGNQEWEALCDRVPAYVNLRPLTWSNSFPNDRRSHN